jgi:hypothetical protein
MTFQQKLDSILFKLAVFWENKRISKKKTGIFLIAVIVLSMVLFQGGENNLLFPFQVKAVIVKDDKPSDMDSDVDSIANIGINNSDYTNAQSLDGTDQVINEDFTSDNTKGGKLKIMAQLTGEILDQRGQSYRHFYNTTTNSYRFETSSAVYKENVVTGTNWVLPDEYPTRFIIRLENGSIYRYETPDEVVSFFLSINNNTLWGVGVEGFDGVLGFALNIDDTNGHGQYLYYPRLKDGTIPAFNQPLYVIYNHLYVNISDTIYDTILNNKSLYGAPQNPRNNLHFENNTNTMTIWFNTDGVSILGQDFDFKFGLKWNITDNSFHLITDFRCTSRGFDDVGLTYEILVSPQAEDTVWQPKYFTVTNGTNSKTLNVSQAWETGTYLQDFYSKIGIVSENGNTFWFSFDDMVNAGFSEKYLNLHNQDIPARGVKKSLRAGMYGYGSYTQNTWIEVDPTFSAKQTTDEFDFDIFFDGTPSYTTETARDDIEVGFENTNDGMFRGFVAFNTGITDRIQVIENHTLTMYQERETFQANEYIALSLYFNDLLVGGFWNETYADANDQTAFEQSKYWTEPSFWVSNFLNGNNTMTSAVVDTMLQNWKNHHNLDSASRQYIPLIMENGTNADWSTDDQVDFSESTISPTSQQMTLIFDYILVETLDTTLFQNYKNITIDSTKVTGNHTNFPILLNFYDPLLRNTARVQSNGNDIAFRDNNGYKLAYDLELFNQTFNSSHAHLVCWVNLFDLVDYEDTIIEMWYGNPSLSAQEEPENVWNNFAGVWHLKEDPSGSPPQITDSTSNNIDGTSVGSMTSEDQIAGKIDGSLDFDGSDDYISLGDQSSLKLTSAFTIQAWYKGFSEPARATIFTTGYTFANDIGIRISGYFDSGDTRAFISYGQGTSLDSVYSDAELPENTWIYIVVTWDGTTMKLYINATKQADEGTLGIDYNTDGSAIGGNIANSAQRFNGSIDEVRVSNVPRSANWVLTEYNNQYSPNTFYEVSEEHNYRLEWEHQVQNVPDSSMDSFNVTIYGFSSQDNGGIKDYPLNAEWFYYYKAFTIDNTKVSGSGSHTNFTVLININDTDLRTKAQDDGDDIAFGDDTTFYSHEIEYFDRVNNTHAWLIAWVRIPSLSTSEDTVFYMYYSNKTMTAQESSEDVWDSNYRGVWHLGDDPSPYYYDSTSYSHDGLALNSPWNDTTSKIDGGVSFDDINERAVDISHTTDLQLASNVYIHVWIRTSDTESDVGLVVNKWGNAASDRNYWLGKLDDNWFSFFLDDTYRLDYALSNFNDGEWHQVVVTANSTTMEMFLDGVSVNSTSWDGTSNTGVSDLQIGKASETVGQLWDGDIDEVRVGINSRGASWFLTDFNSQDDPSIFYSVNQEYNVVERMNVELWNITASDWVTTTYYIGSIEQWHNFSLTTYTGVVGSTITWRYTDNKQYSDYLMNSLNIDYAGVAYWNYSVDLIEATISLDSYNPDSGWENFTENPLELNVSSFFDYDIIIRGDDGVGNPVTNEYLRFDTDGNPTGGTNLTTSWQVIYNDQSADTRQHLFYLFVSSPFSVTEQEYTFTLYIRLLKT